MYKYKKLLLLFPSAFSLFFFLASAFPDSQNPLTAEPPLVRPNNTKKCTVQVFQAANASSWNQVTTSIFSIPDECVNFAFSKIILDLEAWEAGVQYDRFGAMWIGDIEVLRTTTAEPTSEGISWFIEKDLTIYGEYFRSMKDALTATIAIPNNVDSTYTGIIYLNASITFFDEGPGFPAQPSIPFLVPLTNAPGAANGPFSVMQVVGTQSLSYTFSLPGTSTSTSNLSSSLSSSSGVYFDLYASAHGCEEFYYSNVPGDYAEQLGICGGGVYRELQVYIDSYFAGAVIPFPAIYTGGINPLLWRPLTGIMSFDISPHRVDLSPFLGLLLDGKSHTISVSVLNNNPQGYWYLDAALMFIPASRPAPAVVGGYIARFVDNGADVDEQTSIAHSPSPPSPEAVNITFHTTAQHRYEIEGVVTFADGTSATRLVSARLSSDNFNTILGTTTMITKQTQNYTAESQSTSGSGSGLVWSRKVEDSSYPLFVRSYYAQDNTSMDMRALVGVELHRRSLWESRQGGASRLIAAAASGSGAGAGAVSDLNVASGSDETSSTRVEVEWSNAVLSKAHYNRTLDRSVVYAQTGEGAEEFEIKTTTPSASASASAPSSSLLSSLSSTTPCYWRYLTAMGGYVTDSGSSGSIETCPPSSLQAQGLSVCGYEICGFYGISAAQQAQVHGKKEGARERGQEREHERYDDTEIVQGKEKEKKVTLTARWTHGAFGVNGDDEWHAMWQQQPSQQQTESQVLPGADYLRTARGPRLRDTK